MGEEHEGNVKCKIDNINLSSLLDGSFVVAPLLMSLFPSPSFCRFFIFVSALILCLYACLQCVCV